MGLPHLHSDTLTESRAEWDLVQEASVNPRYGNCAAFAYSFNGLPQNTWPVLFEKKLRFDGIVDSLQLVPGLAGLSIWQTGACVTSARQMGSSNNRGRITLTQTLRRR
jgi:hypothetical protein